MALRLLTFLAFSVNTGEDPQDPSLGAGLSLAEALAKCERLTRAFETGEDDVHLPEGWR